MDKKAALRRRLRAKIQNGKNLRDGTTTKEQMLRDQLAQNLANDGGNSPLNLADITAQYKQLSATLNPNKRNKKANKQTHSELNTKLVSSLVESMAKVAQQSPDAVSRSGAQSNQINEIPEEKVDKVLLTESDDESVSSNLD